jgi:hypothetical protein
MAHLYLVPRWFFGFDIAMELLFAIIAAALAFFAYKVYRISEEREVRLFSVSFLMISLSYIVWAGINTFLLSRLTDEVMEISLRNILSLNYIFGLMHMSLFVLGILTLAYATLEPKNRGRTYYIIAGLALVALVSSSLPWITYQILAIFLLSAIVYHYAIDHMCYTNKKARPVFLAFVLLLLSRIDFLFATKSATAYIFGHVLELAAYILILVSLTHSMTSTKGVKK